MKSEIVWGDLMATERADFNFFDLILQRKSGCSKINGIKTEYVEITVDLLFCPKNLFECIML